MELLRENIRARQTLGTSADQVLVEGSIDLPEDSADVTRVILADAPHPHRGDRTGDQSGIPHRQRGVHHRRASGRRANV